MASRADVSWAPDGPEQVPTKGIKFSIEIGSQTSPLDAIRGITSGLKRVDQTVREMVGKARAQGHSWQEVADALGVTRQSAWERFAAPDEADAVIDSVLGSLKGRGPTSDEMRETSREEEEEIERRKWGDSPPGLRWR